MKGKFFKCECGSEGLWVEHDHGFGTEISLFKTDPQKGRSWLRLILAWVVSGKPYTDMILLSDQTLADLVDHLIEIQNHDNDTK